MTEKDIENFFNAKTANQKTFISSGRMKTIEYIYEELINPAIDNGMFYCYYKCFCEPDNCIQNFFIERGFKLQYDDFTNVLTINWE